MTPSHKLRSSSRAFGIVLGVAAAAPAVGCSEMHTPPMPDPLVVEADAAMPEDAGPAPADAFVMVIADAGMVLEPDAGPPDAGELDAAEPPDAGQADAYPWGIRG